jgi:hypothetical protein
VKKIAHHRYPLSAGMRPPAWRPTPDILEDDKWRAGQAGTCMPHIVRISQLCDEGERYGESKALTAADLHDMLSLTFGLDETTVRFVCNQMEEAGICELRDEDGTGGY